MKTRAALIAAAVCTLAIGVARAAEPVDPEDLGLSKTSVFEAPAPPAWDHVQRQGALPRYHAEAPPMIPHLITAYEPITVKNNMCLGCHKQPDKVGQKAAGMPTPMSASHYTDLRNAPGQVMKEVDGSRYLCTQCHAAQADAKPLVENTFR